MDAQKLEPLPVRDDADVARLREVVRARATELGFGLVAQARAVTTAAELGRNAVRHGGGGQVKLEVLSQDGRQGLRLVFTDQGPGIPDVERAFQDGFSTTGAQGLGLGGARRLAAELEVRSLPGEGTQVVAAVWP